MRHAKLREFLSPYLDGQLGANGTARVEAHLEGCPGCRAELRQLRRTVELLRALPEVDVPPQLAGSVIAGLRERESRGSWLGRATLPLTGLAAGALALVAVQGVEISIWLPGFSPPTEAVAPGQPAPPLRITAFDGRGEIEATPPALAGTESPGLAAPSLDTCLSSQGGDRRACRHWYSWLEGMALRDTPAFLVEIESVPPAARQRWMGDFSDFVRHSGTAPLVASRLRDSGDPWASRVARHLERTSARR